MVLDVAINGSAEVILTNNTRHFRQAAKRFQLKLMTPVELLIKFRARN
jgi:predicted nucleic acid-binding protein